VAIALSDNVAVIGALIAAFQHVASGGHNTQFIGNALRDAGRLARCLIAATNCEVVGRAATSPVTISDGAPCSGTRDSQHRVACNGSAPAHPCHKAFRVLRD
jgi:hypothetical protein